MKKFLLLLDGSKGAGKTTVSDILAQHLEKTSFLSIDKERRSLQHQERSITERNKEAFGVIFEKTKTSLEKGLSVVIDCGLTSDRVLMLDDLAKAKGAEIHKFFFKASYEVLLERVRLRDKAKGQETDEARFKEVFQIINSKDFSRFEVIESEVTPAEEIASRIIRLLS